jgi:hypothetical protein
MFAKSTRLGLVALFVVLPATLGGCAQSLGREPAAVAGRSVVVVADVSSTPPVTEERPKVAKLELSDAVVVGRRQGAVATPLKARKADDCGR